MVFLPTGGKEPQKSTNLVTAESFSKSRGEKGVREKKVSEGEKGVRSLIGVSGKLSWPSSGPEGYFKALFLSGCGYPVLGPEGTTALDAFLLQRCFLFLRCRFIHALNPARQSLHRPC